MASIELKGQAITEKQNADDFISFVNRCASQFHAVEEVSKRLLKSGFKKLQEKRDQDFESLQPQGRYFFTRNQSTIVAFVVGGKYKPGVGGFTILAAHTDSPVLKVKPISKCTKHDFHQIGVEPYGGGLWYTWFDRDLSLAGRVIVSKPDNTYESQLVRIDRPLLRIPSLAIHLNREVNTAGFQFNLQTNLVPILSSAIKADLEKPVKKEQKKEEEKEEMGESFADNQTPLLLDLLASQLNVRVGDIQHFELSLFDTQPACLGGLLNEFIFSRGLDNLMMSYVSLRSLVDSLHESIEDDTQIRMIVLFDNEEVGSESCMGASSNLMSSVLKRIVGNSAHYDATIARSFLVSADMAHAHHPNYSDKHEENHRPHMHKGLVIKHNASQRYATSSVSSFLLSQIAQRHNIPIQRFVVRNDLPCGTTIGPILAANTSLRTVDVGIPQLSMHSIREMCGTADVTSSIHLLRTFFQEFGALDRTLTVD